MAVLSLDEFTGAGDLQGTNPDGGGVPAQAVGTWHHANIANYVVRKNGTAMGIFAAQSPALALYTLDQGASPWPANYRVTARVPERMFVNLGVRTALNSGGTTARGYFLVVGFRNAGQQIDAKIQRFSTSGVATTLFDTFSLGTIPLMLAMNTWALEVEGTTLRCYFNGTLLGTVTDATYASGSPAMAIDPFLAAQQTINVPTSAQFSSQWTQSGATGSIEWFIAPGIIGLGDPNGRALYGRIKGPEGVSSAAGTVSRAATGLTPNTEYLIASRRVTRICGEVGENLATFPERAYTTFTTSNGAGALTVSLPFNWSRAAAVWTCETTAEVVQAGNDNSNVPALDATFNLDGQGRGVITANWVRPTFQLAQHAYVEQLFHNVPDALHLDNPVQENLTRREWFSRTGVQPNVSCLHFDAFTPVSHAMGLDGFGGAPYVANQGITGEFFNGPPGNPWDHFLTQTVHDRILGGDMFYGAVKLFKLKNGVDWFQVEELCIPLPPPIPPNPVAGVIWVRKHLEWREVPLDQVKVRANLVNRGITAGWVRRGGLWRPIGGDPSVVGDPGEDPPRKLCSGDPVPPTDPVDPIGPRIFFCYGLPASLISPATPFETLVDNTLSANISGVLSAAASGGYRVLATLGGYKKFKSGNVYNPALMDAYIDGFAPVASTMNVGAAAGRPFGFQLMDDQHSSDQWGTIISGTEVDRIIARMKGVLTGVPIGVRLTPRKAITFGGPLNADFYIAQYLASFGNVTAWRDAELAAAASLGKAIIFSLNFFNGGNNSSGLAGSSGWQMSTAEVLNYGSVLAAASASSGLGGWKYGQWAVQAGMSNALVTIRNIMTAA